MGRLNIPPEQEYVMDRARRHVGRALTLIEQAIPDGDLQKMVKKQLENILYDFRNDILYMQARGVPQRGAE